MVETASQMLPLGTQAPDFELPDTDGKTVRLSQFEGAHAYLVMFICNHCPFVVHVKGELAKLAKEYQDRGVAVVAINANDVTTHPDDSPEKMKQDKEKFGYTFPYLFDESQEALRAAQEIDDGLVSHYQAIADDNRIVTVDGGYARIPGLVERLRTEPAPSEPIASAASETPTPWWTLLLVPSADRKSVV